MGNLVIGILLMGMIIIAPVSNVMTDAVALFVAAACIVTGIHRIKEKRREKCQDRV